MVLKNCFMGKVSVQYRHLQVRDSQLLLLQEYHPCIRSSANTVVQDGGQFAPDLGLSPFLQFLRPSRGRWLLRPGWWTWPAWWPGWWTRNWSERPESGSRAGRIEEMEDIELVEELVKDVDERYFLPLRTPTEEQIDNDQ